MSHNLGDSWQLYYSLHYYSFCISTFIPVWYECANVVHALFSIILLISEAAGLSEITACNQKSLHVRQINTCMHVHHW